MLGARFVLREFFVRGLLLTLRAVLGVAVRAVIEDLVVYGRLLPSPLQPLSRVSTTQNACGSGTPLTG
jgi:hypothetical protein